MPLARQPGQREDGRGRHRLDEFWWSALLGIGRGRDHLFVLPEAPISARGCGVLVCAGDGGVDLHQSVDVSSRIRPGLHQLQGPGEMPLITRLLHSRSFCLGPRYERSE